MSATRISLQLSSCFPLPKPSFPIRKTLIPAKLNRSFVTFQIQSLPTPITTSKPLESPSVRSFTISYLINSCGLSPESAISASQKLQLDSPERPDVVLSLLRENGFTKSRISSLIRKRPVLLLANPQSILLPKIQFFLSIGVSKSDLARTLASDPTLLTRSLKNQIIPSYNFLKSVLLSDDKIVAALRRTTWIFLEDHTKNLVPNINFLSEIGVPRKCVILLLTHFPEAVMQKNEEFTKIAKDAQDMGFDLKKSTFVLAIHALSGKGNNSIWEKCFEVYQNWGWSKDDIMVAFKKHPHCMMLSEKKINRSMDFLVNQMNWGSRLIAQYPIVLFFSLEKRIIPRCLVIKVLVSKKLVKEDWSLSTVLVPHEQFFLKRFVIKYEDKIPELMDVYRRIVDPNEL